MRLEIKKTTASINKKQNIKKVKSLTVRKCYNHSIIATIQDYCRMFFYQKHEKTFCELITFHDERFHIFRIDLTTIQDFIKLIGIINEINSSISLFVTYFSSRLFIRFKNVLVIIMENNNQIYKVVETTPVECFRDFTFDDGAKEIIKRIINSKV